jgi:lipopolysaccharide kinase (Kdo/WaaP) family protein
MPLLPADWRVLAGPPSPEGCSRDDYDPALRLDLDVALRIARCVGAAAAHLHGRGLSHGDLYAHNTLWDGATGQAVLSDFGAASFMPADASPAFERLEVLAWGRLLGELLDRVEGPAPVASRALLAECVQADARARPSMAQALEALAEAA